MKCVVINLPRATARRKNITSQFVNLNLGFDIFDGIDGHTLSIEHYGEHADYNSRLINWKHPNVPGMLGCWLSHRQVWRNALAENLNAVAIFEDDVTIAPNIKQVLSAIELELESKSIFDIIFLDNRRPYRPFVPLVRIDKAFTIGLIRHGNIGASGYIITNSAMKCLLRKYPRMTIAIDQLMHAGWHHNLQTFTLCPQVVSHGTRFVDHGSFITSTKKMNRTLLQKLLYFTEYSVPKRVSFYRRSNGFAHK